MPDTEVRRRPFPTPSTVGATSAARGATAVTAEQWRGDVLLAGGLFVGAVLSTWLGSVAGIYGDDRPHLAWGLLYAFCMTAPLAFRRRHPEVVLIVVAVTFFVGQLALIPEMYVSNIALFASMYVVGAWVADRRRAMIVRVTVIIGMFVWLFVAMFLSATSADGRTEEFALFSPMAAIMMLQFLVNVVFFAAAYYMGDRAYANSLSRAALVERTRELEREREITAAQAVALDRVRIARELHDVVAHHVSAMGVQAGAARTVLDRDPESARGALIAVEDSARSALQELRQLLETLRTPDASATPGDSTLRLSDLPQLVEHAGDNGMPTTLTIVGTPVSASELVQVNLYRIAQEALTNARRHGGPAARADVRLRYDDGEIELEIANEGRVHFHRPAGLGLVGMRERATASGGTLEAEPRARGGFVVRARVPAGATTAPTAGRATASTGAGT